MLSTLSVLPHSPGEFALAVIVPNAAVAASALAPLMRLTYRLEPPSLKNAITESLRTEAWEPNCVLEVAQGEHARSAHGPPVAEADHVGLPGVQGRAPPGRVLLDVNC